MTSLRPSMLCPGERCPSRDGSADAAVPFIDAALRVLLAAPLFKPLHLLSVQRAAARAWTPTTGATLRSQ